MTVINLPFKLCMRFAKEIKVQLPDVLTVEQMQIHKLSSKLSIEPKPGNYIKRCHAEAYISRLAALTPSPYSTT